MSDSSMKPLIDKCLSKDNDWVETNWAENIDIEFLDTLYNV
jgi:hypothetical protein